MQLSLMLVVYLCLLYFMQVQGLAQKVPLFTGNLYRSDGVPALGTESVKELLKSSTTRVNRIVSNKYEQAPEDEWYCQADQEFVILLKGSATLEFDFGEGGKIQHFLEPGEYIYIPAELRHRVVATSSDPPAVWLAIHHDGVPGQVASVPAVEASDIRLQSLLEISRDACDSISELVQYIYDNSLGEGTMGTKADASAFTIADGLVEHLLKVLLLDKVGGIVGEEDDSDIRISSDKPYMVNDMVVPEKIKGIVDTKLQKMLQLRKLIPENTYRDLVAFIDPIDGTKEFINGRGEQCTICLGFSDALTGMAVAGVVYRPITGTWAAGALSENYRASSWATDSHLDTTARFLASCGKLSSFTQAVQKELGIPMKTCGGAGHKVLLLLEGEGSSYIQDRGLNRWDTCACQAILDAFGGRLLRLDAILEEGGKLQSYTYKKSILNEDFQPLAVRTKHNSINQFEQGPVTLDTLKPYSNICGLFALAPSEVVELDSYVAAVRRAHSTSPANYD